MYTNVCTQMTTVIIMQYQLSRFRSQRFTDLENQFGKLLLTAVRLHVFLVYIGSSKIFRSAFFAIFGSYGSVFGHFLGVRGGT